MATQTFQFTFSSLKSRVSQYLEDQGNDFTTQVPNMIQLGEFRVFMDLGLEVLDETMVVAFSSAGDAKKPDRMTTVRNVYYEGALIEERSASVITSLQSQMSQGIPRFYAETTNQRISVAPLPATGIGTPFPSEEKTPNDFLYPAESAAVISVNGVVVPETLSSSTPTTWIGTHLGALLFAAVLVECERYNKNTEGETIRDAEYMNILNPTMKQMSPQIRKDYKDSLKRSQLPRLDTKRRA